MNCFKPAAAKEHPPNRTVMFLFQSFNHVPGTPRKDSVRRVTGSCNFKAVRSWQLLDATRCTSKSACFCIRILSVTTCTSQHSVVAQSAQAQKRTRWSTIPYLPPAYLYAIYLHTSTIWVVHMGFIPITCTIETWGNWRPNWLWSPKCSKRCRMLAVVFPLRDHQWWLVYNILLLVYLLGIHIYIIFLIESGIFKDVFMFVGFVLKCPYFIYFRMMIFFRVPWSNPDIKNTYRLANPRCGDTNFGESCLETPKWPANGPFWNDHIWWWEWWE